MWFLALWSQAPRIPTSCEHSQTLLPKRRGFLINLPQPCRCPLHQIQVHPPLCKQESTPGDGLCTNPTRSSCNEQSHCAALAEIKHGLQECANENGHKSQRCCSCCSGCSCFSRCFRCSKFYRLSMISPAANVCCSHLSLFSLAAHLRSTNGFCSRLSLHIHPYSSTYSSIYVHIFIHLRDDFFLF